MLEGVQELFSYKHMQLLSESDKNCMRYGQVKILGKSLNGVNSNVAKSRDDDDDDFVSARYSNIRIMMSVVYYKQRSVTPAHSSAAILGPQTSS